VNGVGTDALFRVVEQPFKIPFVAALALVINSQNAEAGKLILDEFSKATQAYLTEGLLTRTKLLLRFFGCVQGMLEGDGVYPVLNAIVDKAAAVLSAGEVVGFVLVIETGKSSDWIRLWRLNSSIPL
jgi:hypothetical protein